jgi:hypothetical protein
MLSSFLGVLPILIPSLCVLALSCDQSPSPLKQSFKKKLKACDYIEMESQTLNNLSWPSVRGKARHFGRCFVMLPLNL